jgi:hypothetical protein
MAVPAARAQSTGQLRVQADSGDVRAAIWLGERYGMGTWDTRPQLDSAQHYLQLASQRGSADAAYLLGITYLHGLGVQRNEKTAAEWMQAAADRGNTQALLAMMRVYAHESSMFEASHLQLGRDDAKALAYALRAARARAPEALHYCGIAYHAGRGTARNDSLALAYMQQAAVQLGYPPAQQELAWWYYRGLTEAGTDLELAQHYYQLLADNPTSDLNQTSAGRVGAHSCAQWLRITANLHWSLLLPDPLMAPQLYVRP